MALYRRMLGPAFEGLPSAVRDLHSGSGAWIGRATVIRGDGLVPAIAARIAGLPPAATNVPITFTIQEYEDRQVWTRHFGDHRTTSELWFRNGGLFERIGAAHYAMQVKPTEDGLSVTVSHARIFGVPLPRFLTPVSRSTESVDGEGRYTFDVGGYLPKGELIIRYHGWLVPEE